MSKNEINYLVTMLLFQKMMNESLLSREDYDAFDMQMKQKYDPKIGGLFTEIRNTRSSAIT